MKVCGELSLLGDVTLLGVLAGLNIDRNCGRETGEGIKLSGVVLIADLWPSAE